jgi:hypothetical protein
VTPAPAVALHELIRFFGSPAAGFVIGKIIGSVVLLGLDDRIHECPRLFYPIVPRIETRVPLDVFGGTKVGRTQPPANQPSEIFTICGRRGGKSFISSLTAVFIACFSSFKQYLNAGEKAAILILARDRDQAKIVFSYVSGILHAIPALSAMIDVERADEIELNTILVKTSDYRAIRGLTVAVAILDEVAFWDSEGISPDHEVLTALRPATSTIQALR